MGVAGAAVFFLGGVLLWRPGQSPILLFIFAYQWLQIVVTIFYAGWLGIDLDDYSMFHGDMQMAATLSLIGLTLLICGMRRTPRGATGRRAAYASGGHSIANEGLVLALFRFLDDRGFCGGRCFGCAGIFAAAARSQQHEMGVLCDPDICCVLYGSKELLAHRLRTRTCFVDRQLFLGLQDRFLLHHFWACGHPGAAQAARLLGVSRSRDVHVGYGNRLERH